MCISQSHRIRKSSSQRSLNFDSFVPSKVTFEGKKTNQDPVLVESGSYGSCASVSSLNGHTLLRLPVLKADQFVGGSLISSRYPDFYATFFLSILISYQLES